MGMLDMRAADPATRLWRELCFAKQPMFLDELRDAASVDAETLVSCLGSWARMQCIRVTADRFGFEIVGSAANFRTPPMETAEKEEPAVHAARKRMWSAIRVLKIFDLPSLQMAAEVQTRCANDYLEALVKAGYLFAFQREDKVPRWALKDWPGPQHPRFARSWQKGEIRLLGFDPNSKRAFQLSLKKFEQDDSPCLSV